MKPGILLASLFLLSPLLYGQQKINRELLLKDFQILRTTLEELHPDLYRYTTREEFNTRGDSIHSLLQSNLTLTEFYLCIAPMVTQINNGHTALRPPYELCKSMKVLPLRLISFERKIYVHSDFSCNEYGLVGNEVLTINKIPVGEVVRRALKYVSVDGFNDNARFKAVVEDDLALYHNLIFGESSEFQIECIDQISGQHISKTLSAIPYSEFQQRYDTREGFPWSLTRIDSTASAVLTIRNFNNMVKSGDKKMFFNKVMEDFFRQIRSWKVSSLIVDIRFNGGGELKNAILLYSYLAKTSFQFTQSVEMASITPPTYIQFTNYEKALKFAPIDAHYVAKKSEKVFVVSDHFSQKMVDPKQDNFEGKLILLINGNTASAAGALASRIKSDRRGLIVGEENRDNYIGFSAGVPVVLTLPHSGVEVSIPIRKFGYVSGKDTGRGVEPDYQVRSTAVNFFKEKTAVVAYAVELLKK